MNRKRLLMMVGLLGVVAAATGCKDQELRDYLGVSGEMYAWEVKVGEAICQLEEKTAGLDPTKRICPGGGTDVITPPKYPPR